MTLDIKEFLLKGLENDERYKQIVSGVQDPKIQEQIDVTVKQFLLQMSQGMEQLQKSLADPELRKQLGESMGRSNK